MGHQGQHLIYLLFFNFTSITLSVPIPEIQLFKNLTSKTKVQDIGEVKGGGHIADPESNQCNSFLFYVNRNKHSKGMVNRMFVPERTYPKLKKKKPKKKKKSFLQNCSTIQSVQMHYYRNIATEFCSNWTNYWIYVN